AASSAPTGLEATRRSDDALGAMCESRWNIGCPQSAELLATNRAIWNFDGAATSCYHCANDCRKRLRSVARRVGREHTGAARPAAGGGAMAASAPTIPSFDAPELAELKRALVTAAHVLDHEGITDGYGHVSVRVPGAPAFLTLAAVSPGLATLDRL